MLLVGIPSFREQKWNREGMPVPAIRESWQRSPHNESEGNNPQDEHHDIFARSVGPYEASPWSTSQTSLQRPQNSHALHGAPVQEGVTNDPSRRHGGGDGRAAHQIHQERRDCTSDDAVGLVPVFGEQLHDPADRIPSERGALVVDVRKKRREHGDGNGGDGGADVDMNHRSDQKPRADSAGHVTATHHCSAHIHWSLI